MKEKSLPLDELDLLRGFVLPFDESCEKNKHIISFQN